MLRSILVDGIKRLRKGRVGEPQLEAEILLSYLLKIDRFDLYLKPNFKLSSKEKATLIKQYFQLIERRVGGEPLAYIVGHKEFWSLDFFVSPYTLIPRPETELIIETLTDDLFSSLKKAQLIGDIGTGTGCIAISLYVEMLKKGIVHYPSVIATDISQQALKIAFMNKRRLLMGEKPRLFFINADWLSSFKKDTFDILISNPPYIPQKDYDELMPEVRLFEPKEALIGGDDGLYFVKRLFLEGSQVLKKGGVLVFEIGYNQKGQIKELLSFHKDVFELIYIKDDLQGHPRVVCVSKIR